MRWKRDYGLLQGHLLLCKLGKTAARAPNFTPLQIQATNLARGVPRSRQARLAGWLERLANYNPRMRNELTTTSPDCCDALLHPCYCLDQPIPFPLPFAPRLHMDSSSFRGLPNHICLRDISRPDVQTRFPWLQS
jgi:hypothetical protein